MSVVVSSSPTQTDLNKNISPFNNELLTQYPMDTALKWKQISEVDNLFLKVFPDPEKHPEVLPKIETSEQLDEIYREKDKEIVVLTDHLSKAIQKVLQFYRARLEWEIQSHLPSELEANKQLIKKLDAEYSKYCAEETNVCNQIAALDIRKKTPTAIIRNLNGIMQIKEMDEMQEIERKLEEKKNKSNAAYQELQKSLQQQDILATEKIAFKIRLRHVNFILTHPAALEIIPSIFKAFLNKYSRLYFNYFGSKTNMEEAATKFSSHCAYSDKQDPTYDDKQLELLDNFKYWHQTFVERRDALKSTSFPTADALSGSSMFQDNFGKLFSNT
jgi:hypothetical protein